MNAIQNQTAVVETPVVITTSENDAADRNAERQQFMRDFFHTARNGQGTEKLDDASLFSFKDLTFFKGLYGGYTKRDGQEVPGFLTKQSNAFPLGVLGEVEKLQADRAALKLRGYDLDDKDLRRYLYVLSHMQKLQAVIKHLESAILRRKIEYAENRGKEVQPVVAQVKTVVQGVVKQGAQWNKDRDVNKAEALVAASITEEQLSKMLKDSKIHSTKVLCIYSDRERLCFEKSGVSVRYMIEKRA